MVSEIDKLLIMLIWRENMDAFWIWETSILVFNMNIGETYIYQIKDVLRLQGIMKWLGEESTGGWIEVGPVEMALMDSLNQRKYADQFQRESMKKIQKTY